MAQSQKQKLDPKIVFLLEQPSENHSQMAEKSILSLQMAQEQFPQTKFIMEELIKSVDLLKPKQHIWDTKLEEYIKLNQSGDDRLTVDQSGVSRLLAKKLLEKSSCEKRSQEVKNNLKSILKQIQIQRQVLETVEKELRKFK